MLLPLNRVADGTILETIPMGEDGDNGTHWTPAIASRSDAAPV